MTVHHTGVLVIGSGFSGLGMAISLRTRGRDDFLVLEKAQSVGGTWRDNTYPGCACDVPSHMYSYSFEPNPEWSQMWSAQPEILSYLQRLSVKYRLDDNIRFGVECDGGHWDESEHRWHITTTNGDEYVAQFIVSGIGALHVPNTPELAGVESFTGAAFHSARWDHQVDLTDKKVAVIGTGASAVQFVPQIAETVGELHLYQRSPAWVLPRRNFAIPSALRRLFRRSAVARKVFRNSIYWSAESLAIGLNGHSNLLRPVEAAARRFIEKEVSDPELRKKLTPSYRIGCKRLLGSNTYYRALTRPNADVITDPIAEVRERSIVTADGTEREVDVIIYATGFHVTDGFDGLNVAGIGGRKLVQHWQQHGIETHLGIVAAGYPNAFFLLGPNTGLGHNSVVFMIEQQIGYALRAIEFVESGAADGLTVRRQTQDRFTAEIQAKLNKGVWSTGGCTSWYLDSHGANRTVWPGFTWQYWLRTRKFDPAQYEFLLPTGAGTDSENVEEVRI
ncbi:4-hydroxyacetophenone monooxygenase [Rhodococcus sp. 05-340-1]|uniref:flavin-containing monooxygenase n=1 Tax=unclassified Rhodococcus (in: high G+C Gram-positive bacteria) TaxID=192944 RepID=UPI000B9BA030|nr:MULTISPECIES: NAD(P)/FAD-dependent oxidoreductase [unclassified Rhodococcus (in: high G+C Gram-positive bacteria)]OZD72526.1 4-hydroxyacetophenone monooxygenase [Rhodococcus sp. 05-340-2]OZD76207.1 4-hydroxyacetophenone monooxygenase [Rhodococcus sp. 05-340-1]OZF32715.1 4-hydroxyacetophenone monooxygenase [Rhodococcus sp. 14-2483-1-2]